MKKILSTFLIAAIAFNTHAQSPQGINYQAVAYDNLSQPVINHAVGVRLSVLDGGANGPVLYEETQVPNTDNTGLFSIVIGNGTVVSGTFAGINWSNGTKWLKTEIDITGGNNYVVMGSSQFLSTPYSFYADKAGYAARAGFYSGSFTIPDGFNTATTVIISNSSSYTVPAGKNLYLPTAEQALSIDGDTLYTNLSGGGANARTFVAAGENSVVKMKYQPLAGFLVDKIVTWKTFDLLNTAFTVPADKQFIVVNTSFFYNLNCQLTINGIPSNLLSNTILSPGTALSTVNCTNLSGDKFVINGYFMDR